jgi:hypothetical protein
MSTSAVHVAVFDTFADWEVGYATAHIRSRNWQREPGRYSITTVGLTREPVTTMGGMRIMPGIALDELRGEDSAMLILAGGDTWGEDSMAGFRAAARRFLAAGMPPVHFARAIFERLALYPAEVAASWFKLYGDRDPAGFYELMAVPAGGPA